MDIKVRRAIYLIFILIFFISVTFIILYASGYKYNWSKKILERTGVFFLKSYPKDATVYLNNVKQKKETPTLVNRLLPNYYQVKVTKNGYLDWQKNLPIFPQSTTFIEDISLFKKQLVPQLIAKEEFIDFLQSPNKLFVILSQKNTNNTSLWLFNVLNDNFTELYHSTLTKQFELISWTNNNQKVLVKQNNNFFILNISQKNLLYPLSDVSKLPFNNLIWDTYNNNIIYGTYQQRIYQLDLLSKKATLLNNLPVLAMVNYKTDVLAIVKEQNKYLIKFIKNDEEPILSLPYSQGYQLENPGFGYISLFDQDQGTLYLIEPENSTQPIKTVIKNLEDLKWHDNQFLFWNSNELWVYYPDVNQKILIERSSEPIISGFWHPNVVYVYRQTANELKVYELDSRDQRNIYSLITFETDNNNLVFTNKKGDYLYLITSYNGINGLYKVEIQ